MTDIQDSPLKELQNLLSLIEFPSELIEKDQDLHFETLLVVLDEEPNPETEPQWVAQLFFLEDLLRVEELSRYLLDSDTFTLQFLLELPVDYSGLKGPEAFKALQLLDACNKILPIGHLGVNENQKVYFKYALKLANQTPSLPVVVDILNLVQYFLIRFSPVLELAKDSDQTIEALIEGLEKAVTRA